MCFTILRYFIGHITITDSKLGSTLFESFVFQYYWFNKHSWWQYYFYSDSFLFLFRVKWCLECNWHHPKIQFLWFRYMYNYFLWKTSKKKNLCHSCNLFSVTIRIDTVYIKIASSADYLHSWTLPYIQNVFLTVQFGKRFLQLQ